MKRGDIVLSGFIGGLITAWFLSLFGVNKMLIEVVQPMTSIILTNSHYYVFIGMIGLIGGSFTRTISTSSK